MQTTNVYIKYFAVRMLIELLFYFKSILYNKHALYKKLSNKYRKILMQNEFDILNL